jgi:hypothetical protein
VWGVASSSYQIEVTPISISPAAILGTTLC